MLIDQLMVIHDFYVETLSRTAGVAKPILPFDFEAFRTQALPKYEGKAVL